MFGDLRLRDALLKRLEDTDSRIKVQARSAIYHLQDSNDSQCCVTNYFLLLIQFDPDYQVRFEALAHIAFSQHTLPGIIDRILDPDSSVRCKALIILSENPQTRVIIN